MTPYRIYDFFAGRPKIDGGLEAVAEARAER